MLEEADRWFIDYLTDMRAGYELTATERDKLRDIASRANAAEVAELSRVLVHLDTSRVIMTHRQSGKTYAQQQAAQRSNLHQPRSRHNGSVSGPVNLRLSNAVLDIRFGNGDVIRWVARGRGNANRHIEYTYAAVKADDHWFITGAGHWYGTNKLTKDQMCEVLARDEVIHVESCTEFTSAKTW